MTETATLKPPKAKRRFLPKTRKGWLLAGSVLAVALAGTAAGVWLLLPRTQPQVATTQTLTVEATTLKTTVSSTGTLEPEQQVELSFGSASTVESVAVAVGDEVKKGATLATIDDQALEIAVSSAEADVAAAEASVAELADADDTSSTALATANANLNLKQTALSQAEANLAAAKLTAPFDGLVAEVGIAVGDQTSSSSASGQASAAGPTTQSASSSTASTSTAIVLISKDSYTVTTTVSSSDISSIKKGLQAELTVSGSADPLYGTVSAVAVQATSSGNSTATFPVTIDVTGTQDGLFAGSSVQVEIVTAQHNNVIAVQAAAISTGDGKSTVTKLVDGVETPTEVTTGETIDGSVIVTSGLAAGDQIVVTGFAGRGGQTDTGDQEDGQFPGGGEFPGGNGEMPDGQGPPAGGGFPGGQEPGQ